MVLNLKKTSITRKFSSTKRKASSKMISSLNLTPSLKGMSSPKKAIPSQKDIKGKTIDTSKEAINCKNDRKSTNS